MRAAIQRGFGPAIGNNACRRHNRLTAQRRKAPAGLAAPGPVLVYHAPMGSGQVGRVRSERLRRRARRTAGAVTLLLAATMPAAAQVCAGPGSEPVVIGRVDGWRTLTSDTGLRLTPAAEQLRAVADSRPRDTR